MGEEPRAIRNDIEATRRDMDDTLNAIEDRVSPRRVAQRGTNRVRDAVGGVADKVMGTAQQATDQVGDGGDSRLAHARDGMRGAPESVKQQTQGNPLAAGLVAFGAGLLLASVLPKTEAEQRAASRAAEGLQPVAGQLADAGQGVVQDVKESAQQAAERTKETAQQAAETTKEAGKEAAEEVQGEAKGSAGAVRDDARSSAEQVASKRR